MTNLTTKSAAFWRFIILVMSIGSLVMVFQPFSITVFAIGCVLAFVSALVFNLMPVLQSGVHPKQIAKVALIIVIVFAVMFVLAYLATYGYVLYLQVR